MEKQTGEMMRSCVQTEELAVQHVRHPSQGMPIAEIGGGQSAPNVVQRQSAFDDRVLGDVVLVVIVGEIEAANWSKNGNAQFRRRPSADQSGSSFGRTPAPSQSRIATLRSKPKRGRPA